MSMPPKDIEPSALFVKLTSVVRPHRVVDLPRKGPDGEPIGRVAMVALTQSEMIAAAAEAHTRTRKALSEGLPKKEEYSLGSDDLLNNYAATEILYRACKDIDDPTLKRGAFRTPHEIAKGFTADEVGVLYTDYLLVAQETGPIVANMSEEEVDAWVKVLAEGGSALPLSCLSYGALTSLVRFMALRLVSYETAKSSLGSPASPITDVEDTQEY